MLNTRSRSPVSAEKVNNVIVEIFTVAMLIVGGLLTFVSVAAAT